MSAKRVVITVEAIDRLGRFRASLDGRIIIAASRQVFLDSARQLIDLGHDPSSILEMKHVGSDQFALRGPIGVAAQFDVVARARGTAFVRRPQPAESPADSQNNPAGCADEIGAAEGPIEEEDATGGCGKPALAGEPAMASHRARRAEPQGVKNSRI
jgi:hypothetical protein